jgi:Zn-dependent membrane protease YugP
MRTSDILYFVGILVAIISIVISFNVKGRFNKWAKVPNRRRITGREVAERMLHAAGIYDVGINQTHGVLTDHYDPRNKTVNLSEAVYNEASISAVAVAAHECGHAIQHHEAYAPLTLRHKLVPIANIGSRAAIWLFMIGLFMVYLTESTGMMWIVDIGIICYATAVIFHLVTLPVEFNASLRALTTLRNSDILMDDEMPGARKVLSAAALTYVAAAAAAAIQLLRMIAIRKRD